jgi:hypothetical protein
MVVMSSKEKRKAEKEWKSQPLETELGSIT